MVTSNELKAWVIAMAFVAIAVLLNGCASVQANPAETAKWQALTDRATAAFRIAPVSVQLVAGERGRYHCGSRQLDLGTDQPERGMRFLAAHELGHAVAEKCGDVLAQEIDADIIAVRVFEIWGMMPYQAAKEVATYLWSAAKDGRMRGMPGYNACAEMVAVLRAYPAVSDPTDGTCADALRATR
jgi:hypothetical protein